VEAGGGRNPGSLRRIREIKEIKDDLNSGMKIFVLREGWKANHSSYLSTSRPGRSLLTTKSKDCF